MSLVEYMWKLMSKIDDDAKAKAMVAIMDGYGVHYEHTGGLVVIFNAFLDELHGLINKPEASNLEESQPLK